MPETYINALLHVGPIICWAIAIGCEYAVQIWAKRKVALNCVAACAFVLALSGDYASYRYDRSQDQLTRAEDLKKAEQIANLETSNLTLRGQVANLEINAASANKDLARLQKAAADAKAAQQKVEIDLSKQQERTASAEAKLLALQMQRLPRMLKFKDQQDIDDTLELLRRTPCAAEILYKGDDAEAHGLADWIASTLRAGGWQVSPSSPIPNDVAGNVLEQLGAQSLGVTVRTKNALNPTKGDPSMVLTDLLTNGLGQINWAPDASLPDKFFKIVVMPRP